jgi:tetratricopeptide (TPR) repeat protein
MAAFANIENVKGLLSLIDYQTYSVYLESDSSPFELKETRESIIKKGFRPTEKHLQRLAPNNPKASRDLQVVQRFITYEKEFLQGKRIPQRYTQVLLQMGTRPAINRIFRDLSPRDKAELAKIFGIKPEELSPRVLQERVLNRPGDDADLKSALCRIDKRDCPAPTPSPAAPVPTPKPTTREENARLLTQARLEIARGNFKAALETLSKRNIDLLSPREADEHSILDALLETSHLAELMEKEGKLADAVENYQHSRDLNPREIDRRIALLKNTALEEGKKAFAAKKYKEALPHLELSVKNNPNSIELHRMLGWAYYWTGKNVEAIRTFNTITEGGRPLDLNDADSYYGRSLTRGKLGQKDESMQDYEKYEKACKRDPKCKKQPPPEVVKLAVKPSIAAVEEVKDWGSLTPEAAIKHFIDQNGVNIRSQVLSRWAKTYSLSTPMPNRKIMAIIEFTPDSRKVKITMKAERSKGPNDTEGNRVETLCRSAAEKPIILTLPPNFPKINKTETREMPLVFSQG